MRLSIPWPAKVAAKIVLSQVPASYSLWRRLNLFRAGQMDDPAYAWRVFRAHWDRCMPRSQEALTVLELGPGDSLLTALFARTLGAERTWLLDQSRFADGNVEVFHRAADLLRAKGFCPPALDDCPDVDSVLRRCRAEYLTGGLADLRSVKNGSVSFVFSQAVLEHVRRREFGETMAELRRITKSDGIGSHRVDLRDHLAAALNNLRFSERFWEAEPIARSGFYTNRLRFPEIITMLKEAGFSVDVISVDRWERLPTKQTAMAQPFRNFCEEDLLVSGFDVVVRPKLERSSDGAA